MADREKVKKGLECCVFPVSKGFPYQSHIADEGCEVDECPYRNDCDQMLLDVLELLKEQEPKRGRWVRLIGMAPPEYHGHKVCSLCECFAPYDPLHMGREILPKYCPGCGAEMEGAAE